MSLSAPDPPDPAAVAAAQEKLNKDTSTWQAETNMVGQTTPYGDLSYTQTGKNKDGSPIFHSTTQLNPAEQKLFDTAVATQQGVGDTAFALMKNAGGMLSGVPHLGNDAMTNQIMDWQHKYMQPIFDQQQSNIDSKLAAQGITQGSDAYNNAQNLQSRNVNNAYEGAAQSAEAQAYNQALQSYQAPIQTLASLLGLSQPGNLSQNLTQTPQETIQPADITNPTYQSYQGQLSNYENTMNGIFGIGSALAGGWAKMGFPSDIRLKRDIAIVGSLHDGTPVYRFRYHDSPLMQIGLMAQDIKHTKPDAVFTRDDGFMMVDYERATEGSVRAHADNSTSGGPY